MDGFCLLMIGLFIFYLFVSDNARLELRSIRRRQISRVQAEVTAEVTAETMAEAGGDESQTGVGTDPTVEIGRDHSDQDVTFTQ